jgi:hypothetical protein
MAPTPLPSPISEQTVNPLLSNNTMTIARYLSDRQIEIIRQDKSMGDGVVADRLQALRDAAWGADDTRKIRPRTERQKSREEKAEVLNNALRDLTPEQKSLLLSSYARMGQLYEVAALTARDNYFKLSKDVKQDGMPGGVQEAIMAQGDKPIEEIVAALNKPVFETVLTMHPTNVNSLDSMKALRQLSQAVESRNVESIDKALTTYQNTSVLHQVGGEDRNLTVRDETLNVLNALNNIYDDLPRVYDQYDEQLKKRDGYDPLTLNIGMRFGSWGSAGDKDGNINVTAETTLEAIALHTREILTRYTADLENTPIVQKAWGPVLSGVLAQVKEIMPQIEELRKDSESVRKGEKQISGEELSQRFDELSGRLATIREPLDAKQFESDIEAACRENHNPVNTVKLLRAVRTFGFNFSKIEYRETAEEFARVVGALIDGYEHMKPHERAVKLTELLQQPGAPEALYAKLEGKINDAASQKYNGDSALPITYHSIKRMALARDFPDMIKDQVLAECGKLDKKDYPNPTKEQVEAQGTANMLEAQFLQLAASKDGKRPVMGIVPLFEEPETMRHVDDIMAAACSNPAYRQHMETLQHSRGGDKLVQQVQIAHSDNARRSGMPAARAFIHDAHEKVRARLTDMGIETQFFEGGSMSDAYRNGVRSVSAMVNAFGLNNFAKGTFQGGDLLTYFNDPRSTERFFSRNLSHMATMAARTADKPVAVETSGTNPPEKTDIVAERIVRAALKKTWETYKAQDYRTTAMGNLLSLLGYHGEVRAGGRGSRAGARGKGKEESKRFEPVNIDDVRTIGFSEAWQHNGILPTWVGAHELECFLKEEVHALAKKSDKTPEESAFLERFSPVTHDAPLKATQLNYLYKTSPTFRDSQDRAAFGHALSDMASFEAIVEKRLAKVEEQEQLRSQELPLPKGEKELPHMGFDQKLGIRDYVRELIRDYSTTARIAYAARTGRDLDRRDYELDERKPNLSERIAETWQEITRQALPFLDEDIRAKRGYRDLLLHMRVNDEALDDHQRGLVHGAGDAVMHGRWLAADDPAYGQRRFETSAGQWMH